MSRHFSEALDLCSLDPGITTTLAGWFPRLVAVVLRKNTTFIFILPLRVTVLFWFCFLHLHRVLARFILVKAPLISHFAFDLSRFISPPLSSSVYSPILSFFFRFMAHFTGVLCFLSGRHSMVKKRGFAGLGGYGVCGFVCVESIAFLTL